MLVILFLIAWWLLILSYTAPIAKMVRGLLLVLCIALGGVVGWNYYTHWYATGRLAETATVYLGPATSYTSLGKLNKGDEVVIYASQNNWCKIQHDALRGWIVAQTLQPKP